MDTSEFRAYLKSNALLEGSLGGGGEVKVEQMRYDILLPVTCKSYSHCLPYDLHGAM